MNNKYQKVSILSKQLLFNDSLLIKNLKYLLKCNYSTSINKMKLPRPKSLNSDIVVLYIQDGVCGACVQEMARYLAQLGEIIGKDRIVLIGNFHNRNVFNEYKNAIEPYIGESLFWSNNNFLKDFKDQPAIFILDKEKEIKLLYIPNFFMEFKEAYFTNILPSYFTKYNN